MQVKIETTWKTVLKAHLQSDAFKKLADFVREEYLTQTVYPHPKNIFKAFELTPFDKVRVVIIGQDPYHNPYQAQGLCFSVPNEMPAPPSLQNIFKEICAEIPHSASCALPYNQRNDLSRWAKQGVLLLNATLTVRKNSPASHSGKGWEEFTDFAIKQISDKKENVVFLLWGAYARSKKELIDYSKHLVLESAHPSPFSANRGFFGNGHFIKTNEYLKSKGLKEIEW